jgi:hypothetical protein
MRFRAKCRMRQPKTGPNKTEAAYIKNVEAMKAAGDVLWYGYERIKLKLADNTFYTPDLCIIRKDGTIDIYEIKGHWEDDARVKIKVAAEQFPWLQFFAVKPIPKRNGGGWIEERF